ncbi:MAG: hypothetical protein ACKO1L_10570, partial [Brachymonas sp.]
NGEDTQAKKRDANHRAFIVGAALAEPELRLGESNGGKRMLELLMMTFHCRRLVFIDKRT